MARRPPRPNKTPDYLPSGGLNVDSRVYDVFQSVTAPRIRSLLDKHGPCSLEHWSSVEKIPARGMQYWDVNAFRSSPYFRDIPIFRPEILDRIVATVQKFDVTVILAPTGTGKTIVGPVLHAELLKKTGPYRDREGNVSWKGMTICPSTEHALNTAKICEEMLMQSQPYIEIFNYITPFERTECSWADEFEKEMEKIRTNPPQYAITNHRGGLMALAPDSDVLLKLTILDEVHSTEPENLILLALTRHQMHSKCLEKLVLSSATLDAGEINGLRSYFWQKGLRLGVVDLYAQLETTKELKMSCAMLDTGISTGPFVETPLSLQLSDDFANGNVPNQRDSLDDEHGTRPEKFGSQEGRAVPEMNNMMPYYEKSLDRAMHFAAEMREKREGNKMPSILAIIPGKEQADRLRSNIEDVMYNKYSRPHDGLYKFSKCQRTGCPAFVVERLKPTAGKSIAAKNTNETAEERKQREKKELELTRPWGINQGRIILATPSAVEGMTLEDVVFVIDAGVIRIPAAYSPTGMRSLILSWIDKRQLYQRAGRCGRLINGEYFLCVSGGKVTEILSADVKPTLLLRKFDEMSWYRARNLKVFDQLIWTPPESLTDQFRQSFLIRGLWKRNTFTMETNLLYNYFPFLAPEKARLVVMGVRLGLAAHVISYVAESVVSHKISGRPTKIFENYEAVGDSEAYEMYVNVSERISWKEEYIRPYDIGDSVAQADMITTWLRHTFPCESVETEPNYDKYEPNNYQRWDWMEERAAGIPDGVFWSGRWCPGKDELKGGAGKNENIGMRKLQNVLIRDDGREAVCIEVKKITSACQRLGIIFPDDPSNEDEKRGSLFSPRFNRYLRAADNYNLNEDGRALFRAILTMNSDKLAHAWEIRYKDDNGVSHVKWDRFEIYVEDDGTDAFIYPVREDWKERDNKGTTTFVRFWEGFKSTHGPNYNGCIDPLSVRQAAFFLNCYGMADGQDNGIFIHLNASPWGHEGGLSIDMDCETADRVWLVRNALKKVTGHLLMERSSTFSTIARAIIDLWKTLDDGVESTIPRLKKWESQAALLDLTHGFGKRPDRMYSDYTKLLMKKMNFKE